MKYVKFGRTGMDVSALCLGCMTYGTPDRGQHAWTLDEETSRPFIKQAVDLGFNFFDAANSYSDGTTEEILGRAIKDLGLRRDEIVVTSKLSNPVRKGPNGAGLSRKAVFGEIDLTLKRLGTDYVDLYQIHRADSTTPIEETLEALNDIVRAGKVRYIGASNIFTWQFVQMIYTSRANGWASFVSMQNHLNLLAREEEYEMLPFCRDQGIAVIPYSPLARGRLTRDWDESSERQEADGAAMKRYDNRIDAKRQIIERVAAIAKARGVPRAQVAMAWVIQKPGITSPIVGASKPHHLPDAIAALSLNLTAEEIALLEEPYAPKLVPVFR
ncbi:MAG TPA: aldo/keto reductase [Stellaceae bacterium]|nr:aldo/keto reductase [Stellaceae bacterium]